MLNVRAARELAAKELADDFALRRSAQSSRSQSSSRGRPRARGPAGLFEAVDCNRDGVISRGELQGALQSGVLEAGASVTLRQRDSTRGGATSSTAPLAAEPTSVCHQPLLPREARGAQQEAARWPAPLCSGGGLGGDAASTSQSRRYAESSMAYLEGNDATLQARQLQAELAQVTGAIRGQSEAWTSIASRHLSSRTGTTSVHNMVEVTKALLEGLEGALVLRVRAIACSFHFWRCEAILARTGRLYQEELDRHHDQWAACLDHHKRHFEVELWVQAEQVMAHKHLAHHQRALLLDRQAVKELRQFASKAVHAWCCYIAGQRELRNALGRARTAAHMVTQSKVEGLLRAGLRSWRCLAAVRREARQRDMFALIWRRWEGWTSKRRAAARRSDALQVQLKRWMRSSRRGDLRTLYLLWKLLLVRASPMSGYITGLQRETEALQKQLLDNEQAHWEIMRQQLSEVEQRRRRAHDLVEATCAQWTARDMTNLAKLALHAWRQRVDEAKRLARKDQALRVALLQAFKSKGWAKAHVIFAHWSAWTRSEKHARAHEERVAQETKRWEGVLDTTQRAHKRAVHDLHDAAVKLTATTQAASELMFRQWVESDAEKLQASTFAHWCWATEVAAQARCHRTVVKDTVSLLISSRAQGALHFTLICWRNCVMWEVAHFHFQKETERSLDALEEQARRASRIRDAQLVKCAAVLESTRVLLLRGTCFSAWKDEFCACRARSDKEWRQDVEAQRLDKVAQLFLAAGCKRRGTAVLEQFSAWSSLAASNRDRRRAVLRCSAFAASLQLKQASKGSLASSLAAWRWESRLAACQRQHCEAVRALEEARGCADQLRQERAGMEEQLGLYYNQIDHVAEMLQQELRIKEEMALELRNAYGKMRLADLPPALPAVSAVASEGGPSRCSSEETLDLCSTPRVQEARETSSFGGARSQPAGAEPPPWPGLSFTSHADTLQAQSPPGSRTPVSCNWDEAVERMGEEGLLRIREPDL